jgi:regulator of protease activity HflC (stomatin/prohibitin superfamily)
MARKQTIDAEPVYPTPPQMPLWGRWALVIAVPAIALLIAFLMLWNTFFWYVPPGQMLVVTSKMGTDLPSGHVIAGDGEKGIQKDVLGEGWHWLTPVLYTAELKPCQQVEPGQVGIVTAKFGKVRDGNRILAEEDEEGIRRRVLLPGTYRMNPYAYKVDTVPAKEIKAGFVGIVRRKQKALGKGIFGENAEVAGILEDTSKVLQPGLYYVNPEEYDIVPCEVGVYQMTYNHEPNAPRLGRGTGGRTAKDEPRPAIELRSRNGQKILLDCTIEWEVLPEKWPGLLASVSKGADKETHNHLDTIEETIVHQNAEREAVEKGRDFDTEDFLEGKKRLEFQKKFKTGLENACLDSNVVIRQAFIRNIVIPEAYLKPNREKALAVQKELTSKALAETAQTEAEVRKAKGGIQARQRKVTAETERMVATVEAEIKSIENLTLAQIDETKADYKAQIAEKEAEAERVLGAAKADSSKLVETAKSSLYKMKMDVFKGDGEAYLRYTMAQELNPNIRVRLFQSGPGTLWTNMGDKSMNLFMPLPANGKSEEGKTEKKP